MWKYEDEKKRQEVELVMRQQELELRRQEADDRKKEAARREEEMRRQEKREKRERERNESVVSKVKLFGDAFRNAVFKMGSDPIELSFFEHVERPFVDLEIPANLQVQLLRPHLSERAKILLTRLDTDLCRDYAKVKEYLLHQFELSPRVFVAKFNSITRQTDETMILFSSRLKALLKYYLDSRKVDTFDRFFALMIADWIKGTLSEECLRHILSVEASAEDGWLGYEQLATTIDIYLSNHFRDKPAVSGTVSGGKATSRFGDGRAKGSAGVTATAAHTSNRSDSNSGNRFGGKQCFHCHSVDHLVSQCPVRAVAKKSAGATPTRTPTAGGGQAALRNGVPARVSRVTSHRTGTEGDGAATAELTTGAAGGTVDRTSLRTDGQTTADVKHCAVIMTSSSTDDWRVCARSTREFRPTGGDDESFGIGAGEQAESESETVSHSSTDAVVANFGDAEAETEVTTRSDLMQVERASDCDECGVTATLLERPGEASAYVLAQLKYLDVCVESNDGVIPMRALADSGAEICVAHRRIFDGIGYHTCGRIRLRGIVGNPVEAELANITIQLNDNPECSMIVLCAVCDELNEELILTKDVVDKLFDMYNKQVTLNMIVLDNDVGNDVNNDDVNCVTNASAESDVAVIDHACDNSGNNVSHVPVRSDFIDFDGVAQLVSDQGKASVEYLRREQLDDKTLAGCWLMAKRGKGNYFAKDDLLFRAEKICGQVVDNLVVPEGRRSHVLKLAHEMCGGHLAMKKTRDRIRISGLTRPTLTSSCKAFTSSCHACQMRARVTCFDHVPIHAIPSATEVFSHWFMDCFGPLFPNQKVDFNYGLLLVDSASRYPVCVPLRSLTAKNVCMALLNVFQYTSLGTSVTVISSDNATNFTAQLTSEFMKRIGVSPRFHTPGYAASTGLVERAVQSVKNTISKVAYENPKKWTSYLPFVMWALREVRNETTGVAPYLLVYGRLPRGPLAILRETWMGDRELPVGFGKRAEEFLEELREKLITAQKYADEHSKGAQERYVHYHNLRTREKSFTVGEKCLILTPDSTSSRTFSRWRGPAEIVEIKSPNSYLVELNGAHHHIHANQLRKYHVRVDEVVCQPEDVQLTHDCLMSGDVTCHNCAIIYENDIDFGEIQTVDASACRGQNPTVLPSQKIDRAALAHLTSKQQQQLLNVLDQYADCFSETPGLCNAILHEIPTTADFIPKRLCAYRVPEAMKDEVNRQIRELLELGFIKESNSPMVSPIVCVRKRGQDGQISGGVRICVNFQYLNKFTVPDQIPLPNISEIVQRVGRARYISLFDATKGYYQCLVSPKDRWKTAFVCDNSLYEWVRCPFGLRSGGCTFVRSLQRVLAPVGRFTESYVDDMAVCTEEGWHEHLVHLERYFTVIRQSGLTLNLNKAKFAQGAIKFVWHMVGSGKRCADPDKVSAIKSLRIPESKRQVRQVMGLFSHFREYIPNFAEVAKPLTDLTSKRVANRVPWGESEQLAFDQLKQLLIRATEQPLNVIDCTKPFSIFVDACNYAVGGMLTQPAADGTEQPVAFASCKLTPTQRNWATIEKEAFAVIWGLNKFKQWIFGTKVTVYSDHNPLVYLTETVPKSSKLVRWALALQEFDVQFRYKAGKYNEASDCLSRMVFKEDSQSSNE
jgi:hypothetical protein